MQLDPRQVTGVSAWLKPFKFFASLGIYALTIAWLGGLLHGAEHAVRIISWATVGMIVIEMALIVMQAVRGVPSHFNVSTAFDGAVFSIMGATIVISTLFLCWFGYLFFTDAARHLPLALLWGIRLGIILTILGGLQGFAMGSRLSHTVGAPDGGPGMPLTNWSTSHGDLRIAHAVGLHALQVLPLAGLLVNRFVPTMWWLILAIGASYGGLFVWTLRVALRGKPLIS